MRSALLLISLAIALLGPSASAQQAEALSSAPRASLERFSGVYQTSSGQFILIQPWPGGEGKLLYTGEEGQLRALSFAADNVFTAGPGMLLHSPIERKISFAENSRGNITRLIARGNGLRDSTARKLESYRQEEVSFPSGALNLAGSLWMPPGNGKHPAMVLIHGSGNTDRNNVLPIAHFLVTHGVALLGYDKRGVGRSTGDWRTASIPDLAGDALAAVRYLATRKEIDAKRIGVFGASHGGWLAPLVASQSKQVAFVICVSGPAMSPGEVERERLAHDLDARGFPESDLHDAVQLLDDAYAVARRRKSWEVYQPEMERAKRAEWFRHVSVPLTPDSWLLDHWRYTPLDYDPAPPITALRVPVLVLFGALDQTVLPEKNAARWKAALDDGHNRDYMIKIFPNSNHMLLEARTGSDEEFPSLQRFVPDYAPMLLDWLRTHGIVAR